MTATEQKIIVVFYDGEIYLYDAALYSVWEYHPDVKLIRDASTGRKLYDGERARCMGC